MTERVDVCNMALSLLGEDPITTIDDDSNNARQLKIFYTPCRDAVLESHDWTFAIERFVPAKSATQPVYGAGVAFDIPPQIIRVVACDRNQATPDLYAGRINANEQIDWQLESDKIICNEDAIYCRGVRRIEQEGRFSPLFVQAFSAKLAVKLSLNLTAATDIREQMRMEYAEAISEAKSRDGLQGRSVRIRNRTLLKSR